MGKLVYATNLTLDGYYAGPNGERDWVIPDDELHQTAAELLGTAGLVLFGRVNYELFAGYWPDAASDPSLSPGELEFARRINALPKWVYSRTLQSVGWNATLRRAVDAAEIRTLKTQMQGDLMVPAGGALARAIMELGLVDAYQLSIHPVILGRGLPLFKGGAGPTGLRLTRSRKLGSGVVVLDYEVEPGKASLDS